MKTTRNNESRFDEAGATAKRLGIFHVSEFVAAGFPREYVSRLVDRQQLTKVGRGVYASVTLDDDGNRGLIEAAKRMPRGVVCLVSALRFHQIGTQSPYEVWLAFPRGSNFPRVAKGQPFRFSQFSKVAYDFGVQEHKLQGGIVRVYSPAKTVADCFKYRNKFGLDVAVEALRDGWRRKKFTMSELIAAAEVCRIRRVIQPYLEMLT